MALLVSYLLPIIQWENTVYYTICFSVRKLQTNTTKYRHLKWRFERLIDSQSPLKETLEKCVKPLGPIFNPSGI